MSNIHIDRFIQSLSPKEIRVIEDHISNVTALSGNPDESKQLKYFRHILYCKGKNIDQKDLIEVVGSSNLSSLKYHLTEKIYDALLLSKHIQNEDFFSEREQIVFALKKKILLVKILYRTLNQGRSETIDFLLNETIKTSEENEVFDVLVEALTTQKYFKSIRLGQSEFDKINLKIDQAFLCLHAVQNANDFYYRLIIDNSFTKSLSKSEYDEHIDNSIAQMESDFKKYKCQEINHYLYLLQTVKFERQHNYLKSIEYCNKSIAFLKNSKVANSKSRIGFALNNLSQYKTFISKYNEAVKDAQNAQKYFIHNSFNYLSAKEQEFYANFYGNNYQKAKKCTEEMFEHSLADTGQFRKSKFVYYQACIHFANSEYRETLNLLNKSLDIEKDKTRWNISLRILNIMNYIELLKLNEASNSLESLRKYVERASKENEVSQRDLLIVKLLRMIEKDGFQYSKENKETVSILKKLSEKNTSFSWAHYTSELIPFHIWLEKIKIDN